MSSLDAIRKRLAANYQLMGRVNAAIMRKDISTLLERVGKLEEVLSGVIAVADRKTKEFDAAREALAEVNEVKTKNEKEIK